MGNPIWFAVLCVAVGTALAMLRQNDLNDKYNNVNCVNCQKRVSKLATTCPYCNRNPKNQNTQNVQAAPQTFTPLPVCLKCLASFERGSTFCPNCGIKLP